MAKHLEEFGNWAISVNLEGMILTGLACLIVGYLFNDFISHKG